MEEGAASEGKGSPKVNTAARPQRPSAGWRAPFPGLGSRRAELTDGGSEGILCGALRRLLALPATSKSGVAALPDTWKLPLHPLHTSSVSKQVPARRWRPGRRGAGALLRTLWRHRLTALCGRTRPPGSIRPTDSEANGAESASATGTENARAPEGEKRTGPASLAVRDLM